MKKSVLILLILSVFSFSYPLLSLSAQSQLAVELGHPVYATIEAAELRGVLTRLSSVKPYTRSQVAEFLTLMAADLARFSPSEQAEIRSLQAEFSASPKGPASEALWKSPNLKAAVGANVVAEGRAGTVDAAQDWHLNSLFQPYVKMFPEPWLSLWGTIGITYDKVNRDLFLPYSFTKQWDAYHNKVSTSPYSDGEEPYPTWSFDLRSDISGATQSGAFRFRLSRFRRDWGMGAGSLALSGTARPFMGLEYQFRPSEIFAISHLVGSLGSWETANDRSIAQDSSGNYTAITGQKMFAIQRLELFPFPWLTLSANGTMVGSKRLELAYLSPMMFAVEYQVTMSDIDNMALQGDFQILLKRFGKLYGSLFIDEMELSGFDEWFSRPRNMFAYQGGAKLAVPGLPFGLLTAQYTKIEPFVYAHYPTWTFDSRLRVDTAYTNDGENLGYHLPPNSDEILLRIESSPAPRWRLALSYSLIRHGDNSPASGQTFLTDLQIYGDVDKYQNYAQIPNYPDKNFLKDGIYDYNHSGRLDLSWRPASLPLELSLGYGLSYTYWDDGEDKGRAVPGPVWRHIFRLGVTYQM
ncbi:MAG: hypothetical protein AB1407_09120 [Spirochaetota bacterium]